MNNGQKGKKISSPMPEPNQSFSLISDIIRPSTYSTRRG